MASLEMSVNLCELTLARVNLSVDLCKSVLASFIWYKLIFAS